MLPAILAAVRLVLAETDSLPTAREAFEGLADLHINDKATSSVYQWTYFFPTSWHPATRVVVRQRKVDVT